MKAIIKTDDIHNVQFVAGFLRAVVDAQLIHYASDLYPELESVDEITFNNSLTRAQKVCTTLNLPVNEHFKKIFRTSGSHIYCDYRLSHTAYILVSINGDVESKKVAQIQMELVERLLK